MGNTSKISLVLTWGILISTYSLGQDIGPKAPVSQRKAVSFKLDKEKARAIGRQIRRSELIFFISLPFAYLINNYLIGTGGANSVLLERDQLSTLFATIKQWVDTDGRTLRQQPINHQRYNPNAFNASEFIVWFTSITWSLTIALNDVYEFVVQDKHPPREKFDRTRYSYDFFRTQF